ncbi:Hypothetical predicted protein [Mytilus galloprovincialis]|uniref:Uncharacterized protein n=1 Tax=Mytilus galloprovincialis TaxID=29158 RepID=A0A8B6E7B2_MYTGA|nr:Hypothetical predicted protein [Mytilus galloprovincialis]
MTEKAVWESKDNDDCSDDDINKGSDDVDNDVPEKMTDTHSKLFNKGHILCYGTMVSVINIVITISICVTTVIFLPDYQKNGFHLKEDIFRISDQLESLSTELKTYRSKTIGPTKIENIFHDNHVLQKQNRRLKSELKKEKSQKEEENRKLTAELQKEKFEKEEGNRKLTAELQKEKSEKGNGYLYTYMSFLFYGKPFLNLATFDFYVGMSFVSFRYADVKLSSKGDNYCIIEVGFEW